MYVPLNEIIFKASIKLKADNQARRKKADERYVRVSNYDRKSSKSCQLIRGQKLALHLKVQ